MQLFVEIVSINSCIRDCQVKRCYINLLQWAL